ncbi:hypothetical protein NLN82_23320 [Citrobacter portucalensis]|uniref:hypothetical protein n=1 Tax=Citrobacter portucalensis TaxID=1639133 RepID=UPI00226B813B|nr:hypothetical protein [Citrobacter portucalensis]MCX9038959.1 hypothetical protein [Citrobacter portucalensis]
MNIVYLIQFAVWYVVAAISVIRLHRMLWPQRPKRIERVLCNVYLFSCWWFVFPFMVGQLREIMAEDDDE